MGKLEDLLREADSILEKRASAPIVATTDDDDIVKLAALLERDETPMQPAPALEETVFEKVAHAVAILEALETGEELQKLAQFELTARAQGYSDSQIDEFIEKRAAKVSLHKYLTLPGALLGTAGVAGLGGAAIGKKKGREKGYEQGVKDLADALSESNAQ